ncbi:glycosyltransferase family 4 protein [Marinobacter sp.]|uniref:glycosyltransferase family 4 protein n=1 Tax=Marinobacter sp. TaxID=50741 RepID=UPI003A91F720
MDILLASESGQYNEKVVEGTGSGIRIINVPFRIIPILEEPAYRDVKKLFMREQYDYVQINEEGGIASYLIARACLKCGLKFGIYQGMYRILSGRKRTLYDAFHHRFFRPLLRRGAIGAFCKTNQAKDFLEQRGYKNTHVVPVGLDFSKFEDRRDIDWRARLEVPKGDQLVLYVGRLEARRNPKFIAQLATESGEHVHFVLVGEGPYRTKIEEIKTARNLKNLHLLGQLKQEELPALYEQADVFILPSDYEIYGMVIAESLFFGTPVVSTKTAGSIDIIQDSMLGSLIPELNVSNWLTMLSKREAADSMDGERTAYARKKFDWTRIAQEYLEFIIKCM